MSSLPAILSACVMCWAASAAVAQSYPARPIRLIVATAPSGGQDAAARSISRQLESQIGHPVIVDNRPGANGIVGYDLVAKAVPDGYTLVHTSIAFAINPSVYRKLPFDVVRDFVPITNVIEGQGSLVVVGTAVTARTLKELMALAGEKPLSYSSPGIGNVLHMLNAAFLAKARVDMLHVPYKGAGPALNAVLGNEVHMMFAPPLVALQHVRNGRLRALAYSGARRLEALPDVPTIAEAALPGFQMSSGWHAWFAPAGTPDTIVNKLYLELHRALQQPKLREFFLSAGYEPVADPPATFQKAFKADIPRWAEIARIAKIQPE